MPRLSERHSCSSPVPGEHTHASGLVALMLVVVLPSLQGVHASVLPPVLKVPRPHCAHDGPPAPDSKDNRICSSINIGSPQLTVHSSRQINMVQLWYTPHGRHYEIWELLLVVSTIQPGVLEHPMHTPSYTYTRFHFT